MQPHTTSVPDAAHVRWIKPPLGFVKCKVDASFSLDTNQVGIGMCLRDEEGTFVGAKSFISLVWLICIWEKLLVSILLLNGCDILGWRG